MERTIDAKKIEDLIEKINKRVVNLAPDERYGEECIVKELEEILEVKKEKVYSQAEIDSWNGMGK